MGPLGTGLVALEAIGGPLDGELGRVPATAALVGDVHQMHGTTYIIRHWPVRDAAGVVVGVRKVLCAPGVRVPGTSVDPGDGAE